MQGLARNGFTSAQVRAALHAPVRKEAFRFELIGANGISKGALNDVVRGSCSISHNALADVKRTARLKIRDTGAVNFLSDRIKPWFRLWVPPGPVMRSWVHLLPWQLREEVLRQLPIAGGWAEWPLGVFLLTTAPRKAKSTGVFREIEAFDLGQILQEDAFEERYTVPAGANYVDAVKAVLATSGFSTVNIVASNLTLPADRDWWPGTPKAKIVQDLLEAINYLALWFDGDGVPTSAPYVPPGDRPAVYDYRDDLSSVMLPEAEQSLDLWKVPNKWVLIYSEADYTSLMATYTNSNPASPTSTVNRERTIVDVRQVDAADQDTLDALAQRYAAEASQVYEQVPWGSANMPMHEHMDTYSLTYSRLGISDRYTETSWEMQLKAGATMRHTCRKAVSV